MTRPALALLLTAPAFAEVTHVAITSREPAFAGATFGEAGAYERLTGTIHFALDPENEANARIVDLDLAPRNEHGRVEAWGDLVVLRPVDPEKASGTVLVEVSNRGGKAALRYLNRASGGEDDPGDGFLMRRGTTLVWVGWQFDVPREEGRLRLTVPVATRGAERIVGLVRADWVVEQATKVLPLGHRDHVPYAPLGMEGAVLTVRDGRIAERKVVSQKRWSFPDAAHIHMEEGFEPGRIYELVYRAQDPAVVGMGLAAIRDVMSFAKHGEDGPFPAQRGLGLGISQTGRFLRHFVYQGFNTDERGRQVFDGLLVHTAGAGRGSFNHRFAQPSRDAHRYSAFFYPTDLFPFSGRTQEDPVTGVKDGLLAREQHPPRIVYANTGYEYWGRAGCLLHTTVDGGNDLEPLANERIYHLASGQHYVTPFPPSVRLGDGPAYSTNPLDFLVTLRALYSALEAWVAEGEEPPPSTFPRIAEKELVYIGDVAFPFVPGLALPKVVHEAYRAGYGPEWEKGVIAREPPALGEAFYSLVPDVDAFGNERGGVPTVETLVPLATFTPWSLRTGLSGDASELRDFVGSYAPLSRTEEEKEKTGDGRPSIAATYASKTAYLEQVNAAIDGLIGRRFLLSEDADRVRERAQAQWDWVMGRE
jgi:hypothetical protein